MKRNILILGFLIIFFSSCQNTSKEQHSKPYVVMLSLDGFRWDYTNLTETPNFDKIAKIGVKAESVRPSFPSKTFPNHYSIATGLVPDHHGIVLNSFYDPKSDSYYAISDRDAVQNGTFYGGEPIWNTATKQGIKSASYFWVGSEADIQGMHPTYWKEYDHDFPFEQRIDSVISWLSLAEEKRPHLILWYMHEPDKTGHIAGPESEDMKILITYLDSLIGDFMNKIEQLSFAKDIDIIITSDHGMTSVSNDRKINLSNHINMDWVKLYQGYDPNFLFKAKEGYIDSLFNQLSSIDHILTWKSGEVPSEYNYGTNPRTLDIIVCAETGWSIDMKDKMVKGGAHGYDNNSMDMHNIFYAYGPHFKSNYVAPEFNNTDIYGLIAHIMNLDPAPNDGDFKNVEGMLKE